MTGPAPSSPSLALGCVAAGAAALVVLGCSAAVGFFLLVALNGFSESDAAPILVGFALCVLLATGLVSLAASALALRRHPKRIATSLVFAAIVTLLPVVLAAAWWAFATLA